MATHSSVLAWRIPGTGEPGGLPSVGSHRRTGQTRLKQLSSSSNLILKDFNVVGLKGNSDTGSLWVTLSKILV